MTILRASLLKGFRVLETWSNYKLFLDGYMSNRFSPLFIPFLFFAFCFRSSAFQRGGERMTKETFRVKLFFLPLSPVKPDLRFFPHWVCRVAELIRTREGPDRGGLHAKTSIFCYGGGKIKWWIQYARAPLRNSELLRVSSSKIIAQMRAFVDLNFLRKEILIIL